MPHVAPLGVPESTPDTLSDDRPADESAYIPFIPVYGFIGKGARMNERGMCDSDCIQTKA